MKTPSEADHQVVRPLQVCKLVADIQEKTLGLLKELGKVDTVEARALRDDLMVMCTGEAISFPTLEEYIRKEEKE